MEPRGGHPYLRERLSYLQSELHTLKVGMEIQRFSVDDPALMQRNIYHMEQTQGELAELDSLLRYLDDRPDDSLKAWQWWLIISASALSLTLSVMALVT